MPFNHLFAMFGRGVIHVIPLPCVTCLYHDMLLPALGDVGLTNLSFHLLKNNCSCEDRHKNTMQEQSVGTKLKIPIMLPL